MKCLEFLYPTCRITIPCLAAWALPEMLTGLKPARCAAVACEGFCSLIKCALNLWMKLLVFQRFVIEPFRCSD